MAKATTKDGVWGTMILSQAGHRGGDPPQCLLPAGRQRHHRRRRQGDHRHRCRPCRARVHDRRGLRGQVGAGGRAGASRHAGRLARRQARAGAGLAVPLLAVQGAARRTRSRSAPRRAIPNPGGTVYSWGFAAAAGSKNPDAALEWVKWSTSTDQLYDFGKEWLNPVPRASAIDKISRRSRHQRQRQGGDRGLRRVRRGGQEHDRWCRNIRSSSTCSASSSRASCRKAMSIDEALKDGQSRAEAVMAG